MNPLDRARTEKSASVPASSARGPGMSPPTAPSAEADSRTAAPMAVGMGVGGSWGPSSRRRRLTEVASCPSGGWFVGSFLTGKLRNPASLLRKETVATRRSSAMSWSARPRKLSGRLTASPTASTGRWWSVQVWLIRSAAFPATRHSQPISRKGTSVSPDGPPATTWIPADLSDQTAVIRWSALAGGTKRAATAGTCSTACARSWTVVTAPNDTRSRPLPHGGRHVTSGLGDAACEAE